MNGGGKSFRVYDIQFLVPVPYTKNGDKNLRERSGDRIAGGSQFGRVFLEYLQPKNEKKWAKILNFCFYSIDQTINNIIHIQKKFFSFFGVVVSKPVKNRISQLLFYRLYSSYTDKIRNKLSEKYAWNFCLTAGEISQKFEFGYRVKLKGF